jgi:hypothetical protein
MAFPERLIQGYRDFLAGRLPQEQSRFRELAEHGQSPEVMVIGYQQVVLLLLAAELSRNARETRGKQQ